jgi:APA family basic amino acid/polyamine antiporter
MASYRQLPEMFRRLHPKFKTPWLSLVVFAGFFGCLFMLPGNVDFIGRMYAFGAMLSFTVAHASIVRLRQKDPGAELGFRAGPNLRFRGVDWPLFAIVGGLATALAWLVVVQQDPPTRYAGLSWLALGFIFYALYRRRLGRSLAETTRAPVIIGPSAALEFRSILVPVVEGRESEEAVDVTCRLATERRASIAALRVIVVPLELPLDAELPDEEDRAHELLDHARDIGELYGVTVIGRIVRARHAGRAIIDEAVRRQAEIIVLGTPRVRHAGRSAIFGKTVDFVLKNSECRVMVAASRRVA